MRQVVARRGWSELGGAERVGLYTRQSLYVVLWLYNGLALLSVASAQDTRGQEVALVAGGAAVTAIAFVTTMWVLRAFPSVPPRRWRFAPLVGACAVYAGLALAQWDGDVREAAVAAVIGSLVLPLGLLPGRGIVLGLLVVSGVLGGVSGGDAAAVGVALFLAGVLLLTARASTWLLGVVVDLDVARRAQAQLAVAEERLRFSRDVHDVLGRRLSTIAVRAELAATLAQRGDERSAARMLEVRAEAHEALREAREMARGYRPTHFPQELDGARSLLRSAGIDVRLSVETLPRAWHEPAAWIVRESVTNILRHSRARAVDIAFADGRLTVGNDGAQPGSPSDGTGLQGLRERLVPLGASVVARPDGGDRWVVVAQLPETGPLSATHPTGDLA